MATTTKDSFLNIFGINSIDYTMDRRSVCLLIEFHNPVWTTTSVSVKTSFDSITGVVPLGTTAALNHMYTTGVITANALTVVSDLSTARQPFLLLGELSASDV